MTIQGVTIKDKWIATAISAVMCGYLMYLTHGESGIGWFILCLIIIW